MKQLLVFPAIANTLMFSPEWIEAGKLSESQYYDVCALGRREGSEWMERGRGEGVEWIDVLTFKVSATDIRWTFECKEYLILTI